MINVILYACVMLNIYKEALLILKMKPSHLLSTQHTCTIKDLISNAKQIMCFNSFNQTVHLFLSRKRINGAKKHSKRRKVGGLLQNFAIQCRLSRLMEKRISSWLGRNILFRWLLFQRLVRSRAIIWRGLSFHIKLRRPISRRNQIKKERGERKL
jgi:hypothetical protein